MSKIISGKEALRGVDLSYSEIPNSSFEVDWSQTPEKAVAWEMRESGC